MDATQGFSQRLPARGDIVKSLSTSAPFQEAVKLGAWRGQTVSTDSRAQSPIALAAARTMQSARADLATLARRVQRQGQAVSAQAAKRLTAQYDKLPNMPEMAAIHSLVGKLQTYVEAMEAREQEHRGDQEGDDRNGGASTRGASVDIDNPFALASELTGRQGRGASGEEGGGSQGGDSSRDPTTEDIFRALQDVDGDVTHQYAALDVMREHFASTNAPQAFQETLAAAARAFEAPELMRDIRAGYAVAKIAADKAETLETNPAAVREAYRDMLREEKNFGQLFDALSKFDMSKKFQEVVSAFQAAAGADLSSASPSVDRRFLGALMTELGKLKLLKTVIGASELLCARMSRLVPEGETSLLDPGDLASRMLHFCAKPVVKLEDARQLLGRMSGASPESQVRYANGLRDLHGEAPDTVMPGPQARPQQSATLMALLDSLVAAEEEALPSAPRERAAPVA